MEHISIIAAELGLKDAQIQSTADLLDQGGTVPFIARYRKEITGSLDEMAITAIRDRLHQLEELDTRKASVLKSLEENGHLTETLKEKVLAAKTLAALEDLYLPFRPKRRTKATIAREKGLEPLALALLKQENRDPEKMAAGHLNAEMTVASITDALEGARHIIAEIINEDPLARERMRELYVNKGIIQCRVATDKEIEGSKYRDYFDWKEPAATVPSHRLLAMRRGEKEDVLNLTMAPPEEDTLDVIATMYLCGHGPDTDQVLMAFKTVTGVCSRARWKPNCGW